MADLAHHLAITPQSVFHVASVSKQFTGMSLVLLAKSGAVSLDDDIRKYLPELPSYGQVVTIRHLLTHTGGLRDQWSLLMTAGWRLGDDLITEPDVLEIVARQRSLNFAPGTDWLYSNSGFSLAAIIVKRVTGKTLREYAEEQLFRPLQMSQTHWHDDNGMVVPGRTRGYGFRGSWKETVPNYSTVGATSLFTTVIDLVQWHRHLDEAVLGGPEALRTLLTPAVLASGDTLKYALGIQHGNYRGTPTISHSGGDPGYRSQLLHFPSFKGGVSVLCNQNEANPGLLAEQVADRFFASEFQPVQVVGDSAAGGALVKATGLYWSEQAEGAATVEIEGTRLGWKTGQTSFRLRRLTDDTYAIANGPGRVQVVPNGVVVRSGNGEPTRYSRVEAWSPTAADRAALAGRYTSDEIGVTWQIRLAGDTLSLERRKFANAPLSAVLRDTYTANSGGLQLVVRAVRDKAGRVTGVTVGSGRVRRVAFSKEKA
jgi:CubicO group peptidase (beta-lactamase class C family)